MIWCSYMTDIVSTQGLTLRFYKVHYITMQILPEKNLRHV